MQSLDYGAVLNRSHSQTDVCDENSMGRAVVRPIINGSPDARIRYRDQGPPDDPRQQNEIKYRPVCCRSDLLGAFALLQNRYEAAGLAESLPSRANLPSIRMMPFHGWRQSQVFVAAIGRRIVGTVTLVRDGRFTIPISENYGREISTARASGVVAEITSLAVDPVHPKPTEIFGQLTRSLMFFARHHGVDLLAATVHPRHAKFYQNAMGFRVIGDEIRCDHVGGKPGVAVLGSVNEESNYRERWRDYYFTGKFSRENMQPRPMTLRELWHCRSLLEQQRLDSETGL